MKVKCPLVSHRHIMEICCPDDSDFIFDRIFVLADTKDRHNTSDNFDFGRVQTIGMRVTSLEGP